MLTFYKMLKSYFMFLLLKFFQIFNTSFILTLFLIICTIFFWGVLTHKATHFYFWSKYFTLKNNFLIQTGYFTGYICQIIYNFSLSYQSSLSLFKRLSLSKLWLIICHSTMYLQHMFALQYVFKYASICVKSNSDIFLENIVLFRVYVRI